MFLAAFKDVLGLILIFGSIPVLIQIARRAMHGDFGADILAALSILTALAMREYLAGCIILLMLTGGQWLEHMAKRRATAVLDALARRMPQIAHRRLDQGMQDIPVSQVTVGETLIVLPQEICPVDGHVLQGSGAMDESYLTGEPYRIEKAPGSTVLSGAINGDAALIIVADKRAEDSRYARIMQVMQATEMHRPHLRRMADRLGAAFAPVALLVAVGAWAFSHQSLRFLSVLMVATPCPLLIAVPVAVIGGISLAAKRGIIIRNPAILEQISTCRTLIFDKTGTLTYGRATLTEIVPADGISRYHALHLAASLERYSKHPLAAAITTAAEVEGVPLEPAGEVREKPGEGLIGTVGHHRLQITGRKKVQENRYHLPPSTGGLECLLFVDDRFAALFRFRDAPRTESRSFIQHLPRHHQIARILLVSGDREEEVRYLAKEVGITELHARKSPEEKVAIVQQETQRQATLFVGDGINDAPALVAATVGVALGSSSDITSEAADAVVLDVSLLKVDELFHIGNRMRSIALQSAVGGIVLSLIGMGFAFAGRLAPVPGALLQEAIDLAAVLNAVRVARMPARLSDIFETL